MYTLDNNDDYFIAMILIFIFLLDLCYSDMVSSSSSSLSWSCKKTWNIEYEFALSAAINAGKVRIRCDSEQTGENKQRKDHTLQKKGNKRAITSE